MNFENIFGRIKEETGIKNLIDLAEKIGTSQPTVSRMKKEGIFPPEWAYTIAKKYGLLTEWIMTGEGPKRLNDKETPLKEKESTPKGIIEEWGQYLKETGQEGRVVLRLTRESTDFNEWYSRKEEEELIKKSNAA